MRQRLERLYSDLSVFTHGAGLEKHRLQQDTDNVPRYNRQSVLKWRKMVRRVFAEVTVCLSVAYGRQAFEALDQRERKAVLTHLAGSYRKIVSVSCQP